MSTGILVRWHPLDDRLVTVIDPLEFDDPLVHHPCPACELELGTAEHVALLSLGPGNDSDRLTRHGRSQWYSAVAIPIHASCAGVSAKD